MCDSFPRAATHHHHHHHQYYYREQPKKSSSAGDLLTRNNNMTLISGDSPNGAAGGGAATGDAGSKLKRTFTLPRNPFGTAGANAGGGGGGSATLRMSKRRLKTQGSDNGSDNEANENNNKKKVFRRPSFRKFINKIALHIGGVPVIENGGRVPPVGGLQTWGPEDTPGVTGLKNHGNTCFINAVLQCISHTDVLAEYFVLDRYKIDLSRRNKLNSKKFGTKGEVTEQLALLLKALWACQYSPELSTSFKQVVERHGSQYKGNQQHDALEFLQWLLDKVHEDLNTASKRKYKSIKTSGRPDEVIAAETLENYKRCNNSFIQGIFQAQYRSSLSCSRCRTQSNTFDPFQCISVQLPQFSKQSIYVTVLYTSQQPRQVQIGLSMLSDATVSELRDILESDTSIERANMLITEIGDASFLRTFTDTQSVNIISEIDQVYCIEVAQLKDVEEDSTSAYILLCWINVVVNLDGSIQRFGSPYTMQVSRDTSYDDLQKLILKEMAPILHDDVLTSSQPRGIFKIRISDPACNDNEPPCYLEPELEHPLFMEAVDQALALCSEEGGPPHVKLVMEFGEAQRTALIADISDIVEEHSSVKQLRAQALQGGAPLTLEECLRDYTEAETLTDAWRCPHCQQYQPVVKTLDMWSLPDILVVHFKRFRQQTLRGCNSAKLTTMVDFPVFNLDMSPHLANKNSNSINHIGDDGQQVIMNNTWSPWKRARKQSNANDNLYDLYGICYHHGSDIETGHYTAACRNPYDNQWYLYDDAKVTNLSKQTDDIAPLLVNNSAYILFYQRKNGLYVGSSSNTSSAASTSSVGSSTDHWVSKMPKFMPPKNLKVATAAATTPNITNNKNQQQQQQQQIENKPDDSTVETNKPAEEDLTKAKCKTEQDDLDEIKKNDEVVALRNSQNALHSDAVRQSLDSKNGGVHEAATDQVDSTKRPLYTTSIYINSCGDVDITTSPPKGAEVAAAATAPAPSAGVSAAKVVDHDAIKVSLTEPEVRKVYTTTAAVHRTSDNISRTHLSWMSPQPTRKLHQSQQSM